ncbi:receptor-like serine/threonine-protein kinase ALE2 isoform X2 [Phoenix dactylifera]|uniref:Receptor-like serine/threonine-protein kinase ALE2 isoform X2 n=1 Tax=Phoenix dactylifera TaxID=42345 RepID=A0A8B7BP51_PHODC|nr:receptor-like serine/threonine-protein kinase ALE2 isoform X2 [Phoenix dactylifera]
MGRRVTTLHRWILGTVIFFTAIWGSRGLVVALSPAIHADPPHIKERAYSPVYLTKSPSTYAPSPVILPKDPPAVLPPTIKVVPPAIHAEPSPQPPPLSHHVSMEHRSPRTVPPSIAHDLSPSYTFAPPKGGAHGRAPNSNSPVILPHAPASASPIHIPNNTANKPPSIARMAPPPIVARIAPSAALPPPNRDFYRPAIRPTLNISPVSHGKRYGMPVAAPPQDIHNHISPVTNKHFKGSSPVISPMPHEVKGPSNTTQAPMISHPRPPAARVPHGPAFAPAIPSRQQQVESPVVSPAPTVFPKNRRRHHAPLPYFQAPSRPPFQAPAPSPSSLIPSGPNEWPSPSPSVSVSKEPRTPSPQPVWSLPPPPPNLDCSSLTCTEPLTNPVPRSPCFCVLPIKVGLRLSVALYTFFPLVSEFSQEVASGIFMKQSQVRIMGANAASEQLEKTDILVDLVPYGDKFDNTTALLTYKKFWLKQVVIKTSLFGDYDVLYVLYPGLPPSPPASPANNNVGYGTMGSSNARTIKPLGVDVRKQNKKLSGRIVAVIVLSSFIALILCVGAAWLLLVKRRDHTCLPAARVPHTLLPYFGKQSGTGHVILGSRSSSASASFNSSITYKGSAQTFSIAEIERATNRFDSSRIIGEGGFGRVYRGVLEDGTKVAVKVLKRDDLQGGREFLAEVEMLSRLHHRNLVKLIGICTEEHIRCLVYELISNGSLESHLHGVDKETALLDWNTRLKIALGAARGLAYLHEDSSPPVIHRDFKSSNILLGHDYMPKVSDFGLARTAMKEGNEHISTRVMGTFGYVAPEYAMTGHLLVKSDVYSYGVVLLELLTGRKPVDMSKPPGQENLVAWARPLLTSVDGLAAIIDPALGTNIPLDTLAKVAAIASMCVQPEVSHRPFMGEVVQALKLVCNECNEYRGPESCSQGSSTQEKAIKVSRGWSLEAERILLASDISSMPTRLTSDESGSFQGHSSSGPLKTSRRRQFWQRLRSLSTGSMRGHGVALRYETGSDRGCP